MQSLQTVYVYEELHQDEIRLLRLRPGRSEVLEGELITCRLISEEFDDGQGSMNFRPGVRLVESGDVGTSTACGPGWADY